MAFSGTTNTVVSAPWGIPLDKTSTFGLHEHSAGGFRAPKPLRVQFQTCLMNCSRARSTCFVERNRIRARRRSSIGSSKTALLESAKRKMHLFGRAKRGCHFVYESYANKVLPASPSISLDKSNASELAGSTNTVLLETPVDVVRQK